MIKTISTENAPAAIGPYSQAKIFGDMLFASGQIPINPATGKVVEGGITEQTEQALKNVVAILTAAGTDINNVIKTTCFIADINDFAAFNAVYATYFVDNKPARSCVAVKDLPLGVLCEIEIIASIK